MSAVSPSSPITLSARQFEVLVREAEALFNAARLDDAEALYELAAQSAAPDSTVLLRLATIMLATGRLDRAQQLLAQMRRDFPLDQWTPMLEGDLAMARLDPGRAVSLYREALERMPGQ
ncbi:MAG: tetratricopeptide repeat protein [Exiguobacterium profundum]|nr:MAG: tetratricopeptide repeat protein [Exiguobacterium profundum]